MSGMRRSMLIASRRCAINVLAANTSLIDAEVMEGDSYSTQIVCDEGYTIYEIKITMGGVDITSTAYDATYNMITIPSVTGDVEIECYAMHSMPSDYVRVDGIKNPDNAYIDTGYKISYKNILTIDFTRNESTAYIANSKVTGETTTVGTVLYDDNGTLKFDANRSGLLVLNGAASGRNIVTVNHSGHGVYLNGVYRRYIDKNTDTDGRNLWLYRNYYQLNTVKGTGLIIHSCYIFDATTKVYERYYIPCLNDSGVAGFWDAARGVFQGSSNSTAFNAVAADGGDFRLINFEDNAVKNICVTNWGGHYKAGEMYTPEARAVTTFGNKFENNANIVKFNELQYFTGLTTLTSYREGQYIGGMPYFGAFHHCTNLEEITLPTITMNGNKIAGLFYSCSKLKTVDMSPVTITGTAHICNICAICSALTSVILPTLSVPATYLGAIYAFQKCTNLLTVDASRVNFANMSFTNSSNMFPDATKLTRIIGGLPGFRNTESSIKSCPLTHDAAVELLESLGTVTSARTLKLKTSVYNSLTAEEKAIATDKGWTLNYG